jgi:hypothetical protein
MGEGEETSFDHMGGGMRVETCLHAKSNHVYLIDLGI